MSRPNRFDETAHKLDDAIGAIRQELEESGITIDDWSNRRPHYDPLRNIVYTFVSKQSVRGKQHKVTVSISMIEPSIEGEQPVVTVGRISERFWVGRPSHWQESDESRFTSTEALKLDFAATVRQHIAYGLAEVSRGKGA
jgi:hypothetical protein